MILKFLWEVPIDDYTRLKESGVGKAVMYLYRYVLCIANPDRK
jgi:hypothetical protein